MRKKNAKRKSTRKPAIQLPESLTPFEWPEPADLVNVDMPLVPKLAKNMVPKWIWNCADDIAYRMCAPIDGLVAMLTAVIGSVIGTRCGIAPREFDDWIEVPVLQGLWVGPPAQTKSPPLQKLLKLFHKLQKEADRKNKKRIVQYNAALAKFEAKSDGLKAKIREDKKNGNDSKKAEEQLDELQKHKPEEPKELHYFTMKATLPKMVEKLQGNTAGVFQFRDEMFGFLMDLMDKRNGEMREFYKESANGKGSYIYETKARGKEAVPFNCIPYFGAINDDMLKKYLLDAFRANDGSIQRLQNSVYPDPIDFEKRDRKPNKRAWNSIARIVYELGTIARDDCFDRMGAVHTCNDYAEPIRFFRVSKKFSEAFHDWQVDIKHRAQSEDLTIMSEFLSKQDCYLLRRALIFFLTDTCVKLIREERAAEPQNKAKCKLAQPLSEIQSAFVERQIPWKYFRMAKRYCEYSEAHFRRILFLVQNRKNECVTVIKTKIVSKHDLFSKPFTARELHRTGWNRAFDDIEKVIDTLKFLVEKQWFRQISAGRTTLYELNPKVRKMLTVSTVSSVTDTSKQSQG